jgi:NADPH oxidase
MIIWTALEMALDDELFANFPMLKAGVVVAKCGAALINLNGALLLMSMSRALLTSFSRTWLGHFLSVAWLIPLHRWSGAMFIVGSVIHCGAHVANLVLLKSRGPVRWLHPTLVLGAVLVLLYLIISIPAFLNKRFSRISYEVFAYTHYLSPISMIILYLHGIFCFLKSDKGKCLSSPTIYWLAFPFSFYIADQIWSLYRFVQFAYLSKVIEHPSGVVEVQIRKPGFDFLPGQYVYLKAPAVSWLQWHPFTLTSAPEEDHISLHIRIAGDWTRAFWKVLQTKALERVRVFVDGPYGCASQDHEKYNAIICIGAGIGQTPFASILKSLW